MTNSQPALTPPMGWNSWRAFGDNPLGEKVSERNICETADILVAMGYKDAGYQYVVIDDHWHGGRDKSGVLYPHPKRFPNGMKAIADYVHGKGLKFGIYSDAGNKTCGGEPGSYGYEEQDAKTFASWGVDFLKYDYCYAPENYKTAIRRYKKMGDALRKTGRPIVYSICEWGERSPWLWGAACGGYMWRVSFDLGARWDTPQNSNRGIGILTAIDRMTGLERFAGPGNWNDPDMLNVGFSRRGEKCTDVEWRSHVSMWSMLAAPLIIGSDIRHLNEKTRSILLNTEVIAVDQDSKGMQGIRICRTGQSEIWRKNLTGGRIAVAFFNRGEAPAKITATRDELEIPPDMTIKIRELWKHEELGFMEDRFTADTAPHEVIMVILTPNVTIRNKGKESK